MLKVDRFIRRKFASFTMNRNYALVALTRQVAGFACLLLPTLGPEK